MKDYSHYPVNTDIFLAGAEQKCEILVDVLPKTYKRGGIKRYNIQSLLLPSFHT